MEFLAEYGFWGLFLSAFLAATILPLSSEVVLGFLLANGAEPLLGIGIASIGNILGAVVNYWIGAVGSQVAFSKLWKMSDHEIASARRRFEKYGVFSLLFAWVPVIGDPLTVAAGMLRIHFALFVILVGIGKILRYLVLSWAVLSI